VYNNLGNAFYSLGDLDKSIEHYKMALSRKPNYPAAYNNMANALCGLGRVDDAIQLTRQCLSMQPDFAAGHWSLSLMLLMKGDLDAAWPEYEWRWKVRELRLKLDFKQPLWDGSDLTGKRILLHAEQGFGDTINFVRYAPFVAARGGHVILACQPELFALVRNAEGVHEAITVDQKIPDFDVHCPLLTLPNVFKTNLTNIPAKIPYLAADPILTEEWKQKMSPEDGRLKIGITWAGRPTHPNDRNRTFKLDMLAPIADAAKANPRGAKFFSLQKGDQAKQAANPPAGMDLTDFSEELRDFADTAAIVQNLDLVITADTAVAHVAGALGKPVWVFIPFVPDWRWMLERPDTPWYPANMRLYRQSKLRDWSRPVAEIADALRQF
jgi:hypothetical protein